MTIDFTQPVPGAAGRSSPQRGDAGAGDLPREADAELAAQAIRSEASARFQAQAEVQAAEPPAPPVPAELWRSRSRTATALLTAPPLRLAMLGLNHLLRQQVWARQRLRMFRGRAVCLAIEPGSALRSLAPTLNLRINDEGYVEPRSPSASSAASATSTSSITNVDELPAVTLWLRPSADMLAASFSGKGIHAWSPFLRVEGDVMLAGVLAELAQHLRWDVEDDLSRVVGDIAAHRMSRFAGTVLGRLAGLRDRLGHSAMQFLTTEDRQLVSGEAMASRREAMAALLRRTDDLEARVRHLTAKFPPPG